MREEAKNLINKYFSRELDEKERQIFENKLENNPDFARQFKLFMQSKKMVDQVYNDGSEAALKSQWRDNLGKYKRQKQRRQWLFVCLGTIFVILLGLYFYKSGGESDLEGLNTPIALSQQAWEGSPILHYSNLRSGEEQVEDTYKAAIIEGFELYEKKDYEAAIQALVSFTPETPYFEDALLIKGLCHYERGEKAEALALMERIIEMPNDKKRGRALWYSALMYLEKEDIEKTKSYLNIIIKSEYSTSAQAKSLLEDIKLIEG